MQNGVKNIRIYFASKVTFKPTLRSTTTTQAASTASLGLSLASPYSYDKESTNWPRVTLRPTVTRRPTNLYQYEAMEDAETLQRPLYDNYDRYDPFAFQKIPRKKNRKRPMIDATPIRKSITQIQPYRHVTAKPNHYKDSRFNIQNDGPRIQTRLDYHSSAGSGPFRDSITWRNPDQKHSIYQQTQQ